jgi:hypothetical protein
MATCKGCEAEIEWINMTSGKSMPVNKKPQKMIVIKQGGGEVVDAYTPHWSTCPNAQHFKKKD